jgi:SLT domain-containing protein/murein DD-endopeptidase MepM/ murein hydrolase activator NlpD
MISQIDALKAKQGSASYQKALEEGKALWEKGGTSREDTRALLHAYEQALRNQKGFAPMGQNQRRYDLHDIVDIWRKAGNRGYVPKLGGVVVDEAQDLTQNMLGALHANTDASTPLILAGDMGQRMREDTRIDQLLRKLPQVSQHQLTANFRSPDWIVAHTRGINESPALQASGTSHSQVGMSGRVGQPAQRLLGSSFQSAHAAAFARWFKEMGMDADAVRINLENAQVPFAWGNRPAREMPFIISHKDERKMLKEALQTHLKGMGFSQREIDQIMEKGVTDTIPGSAGSSSDQMHILTTQQSRSQGFQIPFISTTRVGQWDDAGWQREQNVKASRATEGLYEFGTDKNLGATAFNNSFESMPGTNQLVPAGYRDIIARSARAMNETQGLSLDDMPPELRMASLDQPIGTQQYISPEQGDALWGAFRDAIDLQKAYPVIKRQAMPVVGSGSGFLAMSDAEATTILEGDEVAALSGFNTYGSSAMGAANADPRLRPDERLIGFMKRYAEQLFQQPLDQPLPQLSSTGRPIQQEILPINSIFAFQQAAKESMGSISRDAYWGEETGPDNMDLFIEALADKRERDERFKESPSKILRNRLPNWGDTVELVSGLMQQALSDPLLMNSPKIAEALRTQPGEAESVLSVKGEHGKYQMLSTSQIGEIARVAGELSRQYLPLSPDAQADQSFLAHYRNMSREALGFSSIMDVPRGKSVNVNKESIPFVEDGIRNDEWGDTQRLSDTMGDFLNDPMVTNDQGLSDALRVQTEEAERVLYAGGRYLAPHHLQEIARVARNMAMHDQPFSHDPQEDKGLRAYYTSLATQAEAFAVKAPEPQEGVQMTPEEFVQMTRNDPRQAAILQKILGDPDAPEGEVRLLSPNHPKAKAQMAKHLTQAAFSTLGKVKEKEQGHALGVSWGYSAMAPHASEMALNAQRLETRGVRDLQNVFTTPGDINAGIPDQTMQLGGTAGLGQLQSRLERRTGFRLRSLTPIADKEQLAQMQTLRGAYHDPRRQEAWGHTLNQVFKLSTGNAPTHGDTPSGLSSQFHSFYSPMREASQSGQRTFEQVQRFQEVLDDLTQEVQSRGVLNLGKVKRLLTAMQLDPTNPLFKGLQLLKAGGFKGDDADIPLHSLTNPKNAVDMLAQIPGAEKARLMEQFTRAPYLMGQSYEFHGGQEGYGALSRQQRSALDQLGLRSGQTVKGMLRPFSRKDPVGGAMLKGAYIAKRLFSPKESEASKDLSNQAPLPPLYQLEVQGEHAGARFPVRSDQLTSVFSPASGGAGGGLPPIPPVAALPAPEPEEQPQEVPPLHPMYQVLQAIQQGADPKLLAMLPPHMYEQAKNLIANVHPTRRQGETLYPYGPFLPQPKEEVKPSPTKSEPNLVPAYYPKGITSTQFLDQLAINPPAYEQKPSQVIKDQLQKAASSQRPQHSFSGGELISPSHPAGAFTSPFSLPAGVSSPSTGYTDSQRQGPGDVSSRGFVMSESLWRPQTEGQRLHEQVQQKRLGKSGRAMELPPPEPSQMHPGEGVPQRAPEGVQMPPPTLSTPVQRQMVTSGLAPTGHASLDAYLQTVPFEAGIQKVQQHLHEFVTTKKPSIRELQDWQRHLMASLPLQFASYTQRRQRRALAHIHEILKDYAGMSQNPLYSLPGDQHQLPSPVSLEQKTAQPPEQKPQQEVPPSLLPTNQQETPRREPQDILAKIPELLLSTREVRHQLAQSSLPPQKLPPHHMVVPPLPKSGRGTTLEPEEGLPPASIGDQTADLAHWITHGLPGSKAYPKPSQEQQGVYESQEPNIEVSGGPGGGKTRTIVNKMGLMATRDKIPARNMLALSYMHSGREVLAERLAHLSKDLPQDHPDFVFGQPMTYYGLAHQIMTKGADKKAGVYPALEDIGTKWSGDTIHGLTNEERRTMAPEELEGIIQPESYLRDVLSPTAKRFGQTVSDQDIGEYWKDIGQAKSSRTDDPEDAYSVMHAQGLTDLKKQQMSSASALVLYQRALGKHGDMDFYDYLYNSKKILDKQGMNALPEHLQRTQVVAADEAQDNTKIGLGMLGSFMQAIQGNKPRMLLGMDPMQSLIAPRFGGIDPNKVRGVYRQTLGKFDPHTLTKNFRSPRGVVSWINSLLKHPALKDQEKSPIQTAMNTQLGAFPSIKEAPHQAAMYQQMQHDFFARAGISYAGMRKNLDLGQHPLEGMDYATTTQPGDMAGIFTQHRDRDLYSFVARQQLQQELKLSPEEAQQAFDQLYRYGTAQEGANDQRIQLNLHAGSRSHEYPYVAQDVTQVGGGDDIEYLKRAFVGSSRQGAEGESHMYWTPRPFSKENQQRYEEDPSQLQETGRGTYRMGYNARSGRERILRMDPRNKPALLAGKRLPRLFGDPMREHIDDILGQGVSSSDPYFKRPGYQNYAYQREIALGLIPPGSLAKETPQAFGPQFWTRHDLSGLRAQMPVDQREQVAQSFGTYPQELGQEFAQDSHLGLQNDPKEWLDNQALYHKQMVLAHSTSTPDSQQNHKILEHQGKLEYIQQLQKRPQDLHTLAQPYMRPSPASQSQSSSGVMSSILPSAPDDVDESLFPQLPQLRTRVSLRNRARNAVSGGRNLLNRGRNQLLNRDEDEDDPGRPPSIRADQVNISMGGNGQVNVSGGQRQPGGTQAPPPPPPGSPPGPMVWDAQQMRQVPLQGGVPGQVVGGGRPPGAPAGGGGGALAPAGGGAGGGGGGGGGFNNQAVQAGRTFARIGDELAYVGQHMQMTADSALLEGSNYRQATLQIPRVPGATTDTYGNKYASLNQGNNQTEPGAANGISQATNVLTDPHGTGQQIGASWFGNPNNLTPALKQQEQQEQASFWSDFFSGKFGKISNEIVMGTKEQQAAGQQSGSGSGSSGTSAGGNNGTQGFFNFTDTNNPNTIGYLQQNTLPMFSTTQIAQQIQAYLAASNQGFSRGAVRATTDISALGALTGMDTGSLTSQMTDITGMAHQNAVGSNAQIQNLSGIMNTTFHGNMSEQNVSPYLSAMDSVIANLQGIAPQGVIGGKAHLYQNQSQIPQAAAIFQMATNAGYSAQNLPEVANMINGLVGMGTNPDLRQQYALSKLYGAKNITAAPELAQYNQQMLGYQQQLGGMQLQQKMNVANLQITADNAQIESDKFSLQQATFSLAQNQASFNFGQWMQTQELGPIGQDTSKTAYFNYQNRQLAAGYNPANADSSATFKPAQPFGLQNEEFYAGIENQRSMAVLDRSPLLADAKFQQQMKYLNQQESFYQRELVLQNDQRAFDKNWGQQDINLQAQAVALQKKELPNQIAMLEYDKQNVALQAKYLPLQISALQSIITNTQQYMNAQGPVRGQNVSPIQLIGQLLTEFKSDTSKGHQTTRNMLKEMGLSTADQGILYNLLASNQNMSPQQLMDQMSKKGDKSLLNELQNLANQGAYGAQSQTAGQGNTNLNQGGVGQNYAQLVTVTQQDVTASNNVATAMSGTTGLTKRVGDLTTAISPLTTAIGSLANIFGAIAAFAGGGGGGAGSGGASGEGGVYLSPPPSAPPMPLPTYGSGGIGTNVPMTSFSTAGQPVPEGTENTVIPKSLRKGVITFISALQDKIDQKKYGKVGVAQSDGMTSNYGIITPTIIKGFGAAMNYGKHQGVDFAAAQGTPLAEFVGGKVVGASMGHPWGGEVDVAIPGGYTERYLHLSQISVASGKTLKQGDPIGLTGGGTKQSGLGYWSSGPHLHTQLDKGNISMGTDPWPVWHNLKEKNLAQYIGATASTTKGSTNIPGTPTIPGNVASWIETAILLTHTPTNWLPDLEIIAMHESGGNPKAINLTDSNAKAGHPSEGLFQTIPSTFAAHELSGHTDIWNPIDNAAAAIGYIKGRYGTVSNVPGIVSMSHGGPYVGYGSGGIAMDPTIASVGEKEPEAIIPLSKMQKVMATLYTGGGSNGTSATSTSSGGGAISIQNLVGTAHFTVNASSANGQMTDGDKDALMADLLGVMADAARQMLGKI